MPTRSAAPAPDVDQLISELKPLGRPMLSPSGATSASTPASGSLFPAAPAMKSATPSAGTARPRGKMRPILPPMRPMMVRGCVALSVLLSVSMTQWPYGHACGWGLSFYTYGVGLLLISSVWGLLIAWKSRLGFTHTVALGTFLFSLALAGHIVLTRVGYAKSAAAWSCQAPR